MGRPNKCLYWIKVVHENKRYYVTYRIPTQPRGYWDTGHSPPPLNSRSLSPSISPIATGILSLSSSCMGLLCPLPVMFRISAAAARALIPHLWTQEKVTLPGRDEKEFSTRTIVFSSSKGFFDTNNNKYGGFSTPYFSDKDLFLGSHFNAARWSRRRLH